MCADQDPPSTPSVPAAGAGGEAGGDATSAGVALLIEAIEQLSLARDLPQVTAIVRRAARRLAQADGSSFVLRDQAASHYVDEEAIEPLWKGRKFPLDQCVSGWSMLERRAAVIPDIYADPRVPADLYRPTFVRSLLMVPIRRENPVGAIGIYWKHMHHASESQTRLLQALADSTSVAMENIRIYAELEARVVERTGQLEATNRELSAFADSVSHDLKAPLRRILGFSTALSDEYGDRLDDTAREYLRFIGAGAASMTRMVDALLELSRFGQTNLESRDIDLSQMAEQIAAELHRDEPDRKVAFEIEAGLTACADPELCRILLANLLRNAWKFTRGKPDALVRLGCIRGGDGQPPNATPTFYVRDNGAGFCMDYAHELFLPFRRLHSEHEFTGTGIGLAIVQRIVSRHGGKVWAEGAEGEGASFFWTLAPGA